MARGLSHRQREVLQVVQARVATRGQAPSLRELGEALGGVTPSAVHLQLAALARKGYLRWPRGRPQQIEVLPRVEDASTEPPALWSVPIVGRIAAGRPIDALEAPEGSVLLDPAQLRSGRGAAPADLYALRVQGDSMVDACIQDGDVVVVRRQATAENGQTVVALLDGEQATLKRFYREEGRIRLQPANPYYPAIFAREVQVQGIVVGVLRYC